MSKVDPKPQTGGRFVIEDGKLKQIASATKSHPAGDQPREARSKRKSKSSTAPKNTQKSENEKG